MRVKCINNLSEKGNEEYLLTIDREYIVEHEFLKKGYLFYVIENDYKFKNSYNSNLFITLKDHRLNIIEQLCE